MNAANAIFPKQKRPTMKQIALENIRDAIEKGLLKPGARVVESKLSKELGMSRFPIREALCHLENEGLVETVPFKGVRVSLITPQDIEDLMMVRCALEELAVRLTIQRLNSEKINALQAIMDRMKIALKEGSEEEILNADLDFHRSICESSENGRLLNGWTPLASQIKVCLKLEYPLFQTAEEFVSTHGPLMKVIVNKEQEQAVQLIRKHIYGSLKRIISGLPK